MAYKRSKARAELQSAFTRIVSTVRAVDTNNADTNVRDFVLAASIFLAHAELENYVSDLFAGYASAACAKATNGSALPALLRSHLFLEKANLRTIIGSFITGKSELDILKALASSLRHSAGSIVNDAVPLSPFVGRDILTLQKYPSQDNLRKVFSRIGVMNIFDRASRHLRQDASALLESLGSLRTQLAHTGTLPGVSPRDIKERLKETERFVGAIDRVMFKETAGVFGSATWASHMC